MLSLGKSQKWEEPQVMNLVQPHSMPSIARWQLYFYWLGLYRNQLKNELEEKGKQYRVLNRQYSEIRDIEDVNLMKQMLVV